MTVTQVGSVMQQALYTALLVGGPIVPPNEIIWDISPY